jgi:hypothetical protein
LQTYLQDLRTVLDRMTAQKKKYVVLTWSNGFDLLMAHLASGGQAPGLQGIIAISPSFPDDQDEFTSNIPRLRSLIRQGIYSDSRLSGYLKLKTFSDLAILKPGAPSPFQGTQGTKTISNYDMLLSLFNDPRNLDTKLDHHEEHYSFEDFKDTFMQPVPVFPMVVPNAFLIDLNRIWRDGFSSQQMHISKPAHITYPAVFIYSGNHFRSVERIRQTFKGLTLVGSFHVRNLSTLELMMSGITSGLVRKAAQKFLHKEN